jgi:hypothetical protein
MGYADEPPNRRVVARSGGPVPGGLSATKGIEEAGRRPFFQRLNHCIRIAIEARTI